MKSIKRFCKWVVKVIQYARVLWSDVDWDYSCILHLLKYKLGRTRKCIVSNQLIVKEEIDQISAQISRAEELIDRLLKDEYYNDELEEFHRTFGNPWDVQIEEQRIKRHEAFNVLSDKIHTATDKDKDELFDILRKHMWDWWD